MRSRVEGYWAEENVIPLPIGLGPVADTGGDLHA